MARTKTNTQNNTKTRITPRHNRHFFKNYFFFVVLDFFSFHFDLKNCFFVFFWIYIFLFFFIYNFLNDFRNVELYFCVTYFFWASMTHAWHIDMSSIRWQSSVMAMDSSTTVHNHH